MRPHLRINLTPTGQSLEHCLTVANAYAAKINWHIARIRGGTFTIQQEDMLAAYMSITYHDLVRRHEIAQSAVTQLSHYGIQPSAPELLKQLDILPECAVQYESDWKPVVDAIWKHLLPYRKHLPREWKDWPPEWVDGCSGVKATLDMSGSDSFDDHYRGMPTYITVGRVVRDMVAGRNCFVNGEECQHYKGEYNTVCVLLGIPSPVQLTLPLLRRRDAMTGKVTKISVSEGGDNPYWVGDLINEGMTYAELWDYLQPIVFQGGVAAWGGVSPRQADLDNHLHPYPVIDDMEWIAYRADCAREAAEQRKEQSERALQEKQEQTVTIAQMTQQHPQDVIERALEQIGVTCEEFAQVVAEVAIDKEKETQ